MTSGWINLLTWEDKGGVDSGEPLVSSVTLRTASNEPGMVEYEELDPAVVLLTLGEGERGYSAV